MRRRRGERAAVAMVRVLQPFSVDGTRVEVVEKEESDGEVNASNTLH